MSKSLLLNDVSGIQADGEQKSPSRSLRAEVSEQKSPSRSMKHRLK